MAAADIANFAITICLLTFNDGVWPHLAINDIYAPYVRYCPLLWQNKETKIKLYCGQSIHRATGILYTVSATG